MFIQMQPGDEVKILVPDDDGDDPRIVSVEIGRHPDGGVFLALGGENCDLDGELPGLYFLEPLKLPEGSLLAEQDKA